MLQIEESHKILQIMKLFIIIIFTYYTTKKIINPKDSIKENKVLAVVLNMLIANIYYFSREEIGLIPGVIILIILLGILIAKNGNQNIGKVLVCTSISFTINNILNILASAIIYIPSRILNINDIFILSCLITLVYITFALRFFRIKKIKNGFDFLNTNMNNGYFEILFFNISVILLFTVIIFVNSNGNSTKTTIFYLLVLSFIMLTTIQKSFKQYYKQKLLQKDLEETKEELAKKEKEVQDLEVENISISKKAHTLSHKQKSLEHKIDEMIMKSEISSEEAGEVKDRLNKIGKDLFKEKTTTELTKTEIKEIDEMLEYMQSECNKNKIDFELQVKGNIHYMTNNLITKEDLETLLADHIKNAIIAINHTDNINRSILVRLGEIDGNYSLYIYDSGIEFEKNTLENLGKKPSTTHSDEGGTGMGFMNTFDTLRKCNASLLIEEYNEPSKDNYTKVIMIKFDNKNEFKIKSYR